MLINKTNKKNLNSLTFNFSPVQEYVMSINDHQDRDSKLMDHDDLHVLDFSKYDL